MNDERQVLWWNDGEWWRNDCEIQSARFKVGWTAAVTDGCLLSDTSEERCDDEDDYNEIKKKNICRVKKSENSY